ncbi:CoA pyrophosphatase [bacterium]|nr:CoA pyrophosphatase [bacterium]
MGGALSGLAGDAFFLELARRLRGRKRASIDDPSLRAASVLVPIFAGEDGAPRLVLTQRVSTLSAHAGQVAFPGGSRDPGDADDLATALREAEEELGLPAALVSPLGALDDVWVVTGYRITPWAARVPAGFSYRPNAEEVARVFHVSLGDLVDPGKTRVRVERRVRAGRTVDVPFFELGEELIWGATGRVVLDLLEVALGYEAPGTTEPSGPLPP